jgi:hypothetical protein
MSTQYLTNAKGEPTSVLISMKDFKKLVEAYEDLEDLKAYDAAKAEPDEFISWEDAKKELKLANKI